MGRQVGRSTFERGTKSPIRGSGQGLPRRKGRPDLGKRQRQTLPLSRLSEEGDEDVEEGEAGTDAYEYEEALPEEESGKNRRYDDVDVYEYELPDDFEDEEIDEDMAFTEEDKARFGERGGEEEDEDEDGGDEVDLNSEEEEDDEDDEEEENEEEEEDEEEEVEEEGRKGRGKARGMKVREKRGSRGTIERGAEKEEEEEGDEEVDAAEADEDGEQGGEEEEEDGEEEEDAEGEGEELASDDEEDDEGDEEERHARMLAQVRMGKEDKARQGGKPLRATKAKRDVISEAYPEAEFNLDPSASNRSGAGDRDGGEVTVEELLGSLSQSGDGVAGGGEVGGGAALGALRKRLEQQKKRGGAVAAPLPKIIKERLDRKAGYEKTNEDITKWQPLIKHNREAPTLVLNQKPSVPGLTTAAIAAKFSPATEMERTIAQLLQESGADSEKAAAEEEALSLNKLTVEEVLERRERLSRMRALLFRSELKAKRVKRIKSKTFHRLLLKSEKRARANAGGGELAEQVDPEEAKEIAIKQEYKRAQERMTLRHRNTSKWAKRILQKGLAAHNRPDSEGTRTAIAEQLRTHAELRRKIHSATVGRDDDDESEDSDYDSSDEEGNEGGEGGAYGGGETAEGAANVEGGESGGLVLRRQRAKLLAKSKAKALKELEANGEAEIPATGLFALPFMARAIEKKRKEAEADAMALLRDLDREAERGDGDGEGSDEDDGDDEPAATMTSSGRQTFGPGMPTTSATAGRTGRENGGGERAGSEEEGERWEGDDSENEEAAEAEGDEGFAGSRGSSQKNARSGQDSRGRQARKEMGSAKEGGGKGVVAEELHEGGYQTKSLAMSGGVSIRSSGPIAIDQTAQHNLPTASPLLKEGDDRDDLIAAGADRGTPERRQQSDAQDRAGAGTRGPSLSAACAPGRRDAGGASSPSLIGDTDTRIREGASTLGRGRSQGGASVAQTIVGLNPSLFGDLGRGGEEAEEVWEKHRSAATSAPTRDVEANEARPPGGKNVIPGKSSAELTRAQNGVENHDDNDDNDADDDENDDDALGDPSLMDAGLGLGTPVEVNSGASLQPIATLSQQDLLRRAFAGDDVEAEFAEEKEKVLDEEVPRPEGPVTLPGWGQWAHVQAKKGPPAWILKEREKLAKQREAALGHRSDAKLKHVLISERLDKKALKYQHAGVPYPFTSREAYEQSLRAPIGREYNTDEAFRNQTRPAVLKSSGVIIDPIKYQPSGNASKASHASSDKGRPSAAAKVPGRGEKRPKGGVGSKGTGKSTKKAKFKVGKE